MNLISIRQISCALNPTGIVVSLSPLLLIISVSILNIAQHNNDVLIIRNARKMCTNQCSMTLEVLFRLMSFIYLFFYFFIFFIFCNILRRFSCKSFNVKNLFAKKKIKFQRGRYVDMCHRFVQIEIT